MSRTLARSAAVCIAVALLVAGCGSSNKNSTTTTSSTVDWANSVCGAAVTYGTSLTAAAKSVTGNPSKAGLQDAADQVKSATDTFVSAIKDVGKPNTQSGQQAKATLDTLASQLDTDSSTIQSASGDSVLSGVAAVTGALATAQSQIKTAFNQLQALDAKGELGQAFSQASSCSSLTGS
jgi:hypothetical protein